MKYYLVRYNGNWADEFDVYFHQVMSEPELEEAKNLIQKVGWREEEFYFGTNEFIDVSSADLLEALNNATEINDMQYQVLKELNITRISFGGGLNWDDIIERAYQIENE